jgi:hypothetical protein
LDAVDVERRVCLRVAELLRVCQHLGELAPALAHLRQDVIAGAVQDAGDAQDAVAGEPLTQGLDHRNAAGDRGLECQRDTAFLRGGRERGAMHGQHCLVGGDDRLAGSNRSLDQGSGWTIGAADQLHDHINCGIRGERHGIFVPAQPGERHASIARTIAGRHGRYGDRPSGTCGHDVGIVA